MPFINKPDSSRDLTIFMISFIYLLEISNFALTYPNFFLWIAASIAHAPADNPNGVKTLLANGLSTFSIKDNPGFSNDPKSQPKNSPECPEFLITLY